MKSAASKTFQTILLSAFFLGSSAACADGNADQVAAAFVQTPTMRFREAQELRRAGNAIEALAIINALRKEFPDDVDYSFARAQLLARQDRIDDALAELYKATILAPDYEDVWQLRFSLLSRQGTAEALEQRNALRAEASSRFPHAGWWRPAEPEPVYQWTMTLGGSASSLSNNRTRWNDQFVHVQGQSSKISRFHAQVDRQARFGSSDTMLSFGAAKELPSGLLFGAEFGSTGKPRFLPQLAYSIYATKPLADGWVANLRFRRREYQSTSVNSLIGTAEKYVGDFRIAYDLGVSHLAGASNSVSHNLAVNWYYNEDLMLGAGLSAGREAESVGPGQVLETDVYGLSMTGKRTLTERIDLRWWLGLHEQGDYYRRRYLGMAVSIRF